MKLSECVMGVMVIDEDLRIGHIVGVTYNVDIALTGNMTNEDKHDRTIPLVQFADKTIGIHHGNIKRYKG